MRIRRESAGWRMSVALAVPLLISACGGGDDSESPPPATTKVPASASQSIAGFIGYLEEPALSSADSLEPVNTSKVTAQTDETSEPLKVD